MDADYTVGGFQISHLIIIFILLGSALFVIYWLWMYPCNDRTSQGPASSSASSRSARVLSPRPEATSSAALTSSSDVGRGGEMVLYAMEIEPGTVVLQSPHGDLFRILREYDSVTQNGSPTSGLPPGTSVPVHYIPAYTRAHVQNHVQTLASAPPYPEIAEERPLASSTSSDPWRPLCLQSANDY